MVHRDIKPSNLLVNCDGCLKCAACASNRLPTVNPTDRLTHAHTRARTCRLADFGVSEELGRYDASDECSKSRGSPAFQPPEVAAGHETFSGFKVDVWAVGVSLFLCTSGKVPFEGSSLMDLFERIAMVNARRDACRRRSATLLRCALTLSPLASGAQGAYEIPGCLASEATLIELLCGLLTVDQTARLSVESALGHSWLRGAGELRWSDEDRRVVSAIIVTGSAKSSAVLRNVRRMYGEELEPEPGGSPEGSQVDSHEMGTSQDEQDFWQDEQEAG